MNVDTGERKQLLPCIEVSADAFAFAPDSYVMAFGTGNGLRRRSQQRHLSWTRMLALSRRWLPPPIVLHPYPAVRFAASHSR
jgi:hypothetical protein